MHAALPGDEIDKVAIERGRQQAGEEVLEITGFPVRLAEGAAKQAVGRTV
jgi:hypothetical protein